MLLISGNFSSPMNSLVDQTDHSNHFFNQAPVRNQFEIRRQEGSTWRTPGRGRDILPLLTKHNQPENKVPNETETLLTPSQTWSLTSCTDVSSCFFASRHYFIVFQNQKGFQFNSMHLRGEKAQNHWTRVHFLCPSIHLGKGGIQHELLGNPMRTHLFSSVGHI